MRDRHLEKAAQELSLSYEEALAKLQADDVEVVRVRQKHKVAHFNETWERLRGRGPIFYTERVMGSYVLGFHRKSTDKKWERKRKIALDILREAEIEEIPSQLLAPQLQVEPYPCLSMHVANREREILCCGAQWDGSHKRPGVIEIDLDEIPPNVRVLKVARSCEVEGSRYSIRIGFHRRSPKIAQHVVFVIYGYDLEKWSVSPEILDLQAAITLRDDECEIDFDVLPADIRSIVVELLLLNP